MLLSLSLFGSVLSFGLPGAIGGLATFLFGLYKDKYDNNKYVAKCSIEILGGAIVATFLSGLIVSIFADKEWIKLLIPFAIGLAWAKILQKLRDWITGLVDDTLNNNKGTS